MEKDESQNVFKVYNKIAVWFDENRPKDLSEKKYLDTLISLIGEGAFVLDLGCGTGKPILDYLSIHGMTVLGVDASERMLAIARANFPYHQFVLQDMRALQLNQLFDAIISWNSFFHLPAIDQPEMFRVFREHLKPGGILIFTSGTENGEAWGINGGENLFHASLSTTAYRSLLEENQFKVLLHVVSDPECGYATIWVAKFIPLQDGRTTEK
ncbi:class I SAM-dependent DNA methyltransferase [Pedobacter sp. AW1-32]|uniref:class I SAM-dependent DNA methyltransferase n=1 Tax=Pedobacter sp. AW1-32 TaxID=3383026 RepID=UPI003FEE9E3A